MTDPRRAERMAALKEYGKLFRSPEVLKRMMKETRGKEYRVIVCFADETVEDVFAHSGTADRLRLVVKFPSGDLDVVHASRGRENGGGRNTERLRPDITMGVLVARVKEGQRADMSHAGTYSRSDLAGV